MLFLIDNVSICIVLRVPEDKYKFKLLCGVRLSPLEYYVRTIHVTSSEILWDSS